ncbi:MAG TPA: DUF1043 family protein [Oceanospirillales bacterium]|nr:DUF1043 family protein [Oceanospirillales bacterium]
MTDQFFYLFSAALLGLVIGALIMYFVSGSNKNSDKSIKAVEEKLNNYQQDVAEHFEQTADLVDELTQSYKKVFDHLGKSARVLMTDEQIQVQIEKRKGNKVTLEFLPEEAELVDSPELETEVVEQGVDSSVEMAKNDEQHSDLADGAIGEVADEVTETTDAESNENKSESVG